MLATLADKKALADGVLDREGDLKEMKLRGGRQAMLARLEQILSTSKPVTAPEAAAQRALPVDRSRGFTDEAARLIGSIFVTCEERYPTEGSHTVLVLVVERDAALWRERLAPLASEYFGNGDPLAPVQLEVLDRATHETIERLTAAGLLAPTTRAIRPIEPGSGETIPAPLSEAERIRLTVLRDQTARKLKAARALGEAELIEEARLPLAAAIHLHARALAVKHRLPEPEAIADAFLPPLAAHFGNDLPLFRAFVAEDDGDWQPVATALLASVG